MRTILLSCTVALIAGCGDNGPPEPLRTPVTGTIKYKGQPLSGATLTFTPIGNTFGFPGTGRTDKDGRYSITDARRKQGLVPGDYSVVVSRRLLNGQEVPENDPTPPIESPAAESLPAKYSLSEQSKLKAKIGSAATTIDFDLK